MEWKKYWRSLMVLLVPLLLAPIPLVLQTPASRCGYVTLIMVSYWMTEAIPISATSLIPVFAFPFFGIVSTDLICRVYMQSANMMFLGSLIISTAVEYCNLHERIALYVILRVGNSPNLYLLPTCNYPIRLGRSPSKLMGGFLMTMIFLSMWISNTAATAMMVPITDAVLQELYRERMRQKEKTASNLTDVLVSSLLTEEGTRAAKKATRVEKLSKTDKHSPTSSMELKSFSETEAQDHKQYFHEPPDAYCSKLRDMLYLATAYGANLGGTGSLTGTVPNLILKGILRQYYPTQKDLSFPSWMLFNVPGMLLCGVLTWLWFQIYFLGWRSLFWSKGKREDEGQEEIGGKEKKEDHLKVVLLKRYQALGPMNFHQWAVLVLFIWVVLLWFFLEPNFMPGISQLFINAFGKQTDIDDASSSMFIVFLLFAIPRSFTCRIGESLQPCLSWKAVQEKVPWGVVFIMGSGYAIAEASKRSSLSDWIGSSLVHIEALPAPVVVFLVSCLAGILTEFISNAAVASTLLPLVQQMAYAIQVNPLYLSLPTTLACSYAFMLPVATPPNAIVYGMSKMKATQLVKAGIVMKIICTLVLTLTINTLGDFMFDMHNIPSWAFGATNSSRA